VENAKSSYENKVHNMKLSADSFGKEVDGGNPSPLGEEKFMITECVTLQAWNPCKDGLETLCNPESQVPQARSGGAGGDSS